MPRITVEKQFCVGHGMCEGLRPDLLKLGAEGFAEVLHQPAADEDEDDLMDLVEACPANALRLDN